MGILEPSTILLSKSMVCRWTWPLRTVSWAPSPSPGPPPSSRPSSASGCCPLIVYIPSSPVFINPAEHVRS